MLKRLKLILFGLMLVSPLVFAVGEKTFSWIPPTEYEADANGVVAPLPNADITSYSIYCEGALLVNIPNAPVDTDEYIAPPGTFAIGTHSCHATTVVETLDTDGNLVMSESVPSNVVSFTVAPDQPRPPVLAVQ
jgi:hypothetical protein